MQAFECSGCGSHEFHVENGYRVCEHCGTKYIITKEDARAPVSNIDLQTDIENLLQKCKENPSRAKQYAVRILEIDPYNAEAKRILNPPAQKKSGCYVATAVYGSYDCPQVWTLRRYRDNTLAKTWYGRAFIRFYYAISPTLVRLFGDAAWFQKLWRPKLDRMVRNLNAQGVLNTPYADRNW